MDGKTPWESPKIQMMIAIFNGKISSITPINIMEAKADGQEIER